MLLLAAACALGTPACGSGATACGAGLASCDAAGGATCQTDLATSDKHCGRCGHDCLGGGCVAGACQAASFGGSPPDDQPWGLAVDESGVYWATSKGASIRKRARGAAAAVTVSTAPAGTADLEQHSVAVGGGKVYWASPGGKLFRASTAGGAAETVAPEAGPVAADANNAWFIRPSDGSVWKVPHGGAPAKIASAQAGPRDIAADANGVFWVDNGTAANQYADGSIVRLLPDGTVVEFSSSEVAPESLGVGSGAVYWSNKAGELRGKAITAPLAATLPITPRYGVAAIQVEGTRLTFLAASGSSPQPPSAATGGYFQTIDLTNPQAAQVVYSRYPARAAANDAAAYYFAVGFLGVQFIVR